MSSPPVAVEMNAAPHAAAMRRSKRVHLRNSALLSAYDFRPTVDSNGVRVGFEHSAVDLTMQQALEIARAGASLDAFTSGGGAFMSSGGGGLASARGGRTPAPSADGANARQHRHAHSIVSHRDLTMLNGSVFEEHLLGVTPTLTTRRGCLILCVHPLKALVTASRALVFFERGADEIIQNFIAELSHHGHAGDDASGSTTPRVATDASAPAPDVNYAEMSFEYALVSALLNTYVTEMNGQVNALRLLTEQGRGKKSYSEEDFLEVGQKETLVNTMIKHLEDVLRVSNEVLNEDEDIESMVMSFPRYSDGGGLEALDTESTTAARAGPPENVDWREETVAFEELLEWFSSMVTASLGSVRLLTLGLNTERARISHALQVARNRIAQLQLIIMLATLAMTACSVVSGFFGMNVGNGTCGPDGCAPFGTSDSGYSVFVQVVSLCVSLSMLGTLAIYSYAQRFINTGSASSTRKGMAKERSV